MRGASTYWFGLTVLNVSGFGSVTHVEAQLASGEWMPLERDGNYTSSRPQERSGTWVTPQETGPFELPVPLRFTDTSGTTLEAIEAITAWEPLDASMENMFFINTGVQF